MSKKGRKEPAEKLKDLTAKVEAAAAILKEITAESDRALVIIAGAILDDFLATAIRSRLIDSPKSDDMTAESGPLGAFATRINFAYVTGMLTQEQYEDLRIIRDIRNAAAHTATDVSFAKGSAGDKTLSMKVFRSIAAKAGFEIGTWQKSISKNIFTLTCIMLSKSLLALIEESQHAQVRADDHWASPESLEFFAKNVAGFEDEM